ncbi:branched-chain amino acid ABC transporter permease [Paenibacillus sediminis]|uniref:Branched-chain amino acid transport system permease protein n=1 Tax=Paenibacillus sediminis TaxID=664909 RepID=A0ABS4GYA5_9BACL|nr:branched-chain amino acid ABC transporter permease [Paenibacillus sediminis]MBP1935253.1 branched-chain amino acid transport system permease protein [Paenibacillus sediminis]
MDLSILFVQIITGLAYGMLLFMIAAGLTIIFGLLSVVNLAHGALFMIGGYFTFTFINQHLNFWLALLISVILLAILGMLIERFLLNRMYGKELEQVLLTFGLIFIFTDLVKWIWGSSPKSISIPPLLDASLTIGVVTFPVYRLFVVVVGCAVALLLWYIESRTRIGAIVRAGVDDRHMLSSLGINFKLVFAGVFAFGAGMAGLSGGLGAPILGLYSGMDNDVLILSLVIVVIGGLKTWKGAFIGAILVGMVDTLGQVWFPSFSMVLIFALMVFILLIKPSGLFGKGVDA